MENEEMVLCPLVDSEITPTDCMENRDLNENAIPEQYKAKPNWKEICNNCKYCNY